MILITKQRLHMRNIEADTRTDTVSNNNDYKCEQIQPSSLYLTWPPCISERLSGSGTLEHSLFRLNARSHCQRDGATNPHPDPGAAGDIVEARGGPPEECQVFKFECSQNSSGSCVASWINVLAFIRMVAPRQPGEARSTHTGSE